MYVEVYLNTGSACKDLRGDVIHFLSFSEESSCSVLDQLSLIPFLDSEDALVYSSQMSLKTSGTKSVWSGVTKKTNKHFHTVIKTRGQAGQ